MTTWWSRPAQSGSASRRRAKGTKTIGAGCVTFSFDETIELVTEGLDIIRRLASEGMTMIPVSHEMSFVREVASKVIFMDAGKAVEVGARADTFD